MATHTEVENGHARREDTATRRVSAPHHLKELWDLWHPAEEYLEGINVTHLVTTFRGKFNLQAWDRSLRRLLKRHPVLTARIVTTPGGIEFIASSDCIPQPKLIDFSASLTEDRTIKLRTLVETLVWKRFKREDGPLFRAFSIVVSDTECVIGIVVDHIIVDGWSMDVIGRELLILYASEVTGRQVALPTGSVDFLDHIRWMDSWLKGPEAQSQRAYWEQVLANPPSVRLPTRDDVDLDALCVPLCQEFTLEADAVRDICAGAAELHTTPALILMTANIAVISILAQASDVAVLTVAEQRDSPRLRHTVGFLVNFLAIRVAVNSDDTFIILAGKVMRSYVGACKNNLYPHLLTEWERYAFPAFHFRRFAHQANARLNDAVGFSPFELTPRPPTRTNARKWACGFSLGIQHRENSMQCSAYHLPTLYTQASADEFVQTFQAAIKMIVASPGLSIATLG